MAVLTRANVVDYFFKRIYNRPQMEKMWDDTSPFSAALKRSQRNVAEGEKFGFHVQTKTSATGKAIAEDGSLPTPADPGGAWLWFTMRQYADQFQVTTRAMESSKQQKAAVVRMLDLRAKNLTDYARHYMNIKNYAPLSGRIAQCMAPTSTTVFKVDHPERLRVGMSIAVAQADETITNGSAATAITGIDGNTITVGTALGGVTWTQVGDGLYDHYVYLADCFKTGLGVHGLEDVANNEDTDLFGGETVTNGYKFGAITRATAGNEWCNAVMVDAAGSTITHRLAYEAAEQVAINSGHEIDCWFTTPEIYADILELHEGTKQAQMNTKVGNSWFQSALLAGKKVFADKYCTKRMIFGVNLKAIRNEQLLGITWMNDDGSWLHRVEGKLQYAASLERMWQMTGIPNRHVRIYNVKSNAWVLGT